MSSRLRKFAALSQFYRSATIAEDTPYAFPAPASNDADPALACFVAVVWL